MPARPLAVEAVLNVLSLGRAGTQAPPVLQRCRLRMPWRPAAGRLSRDQVDSTGADIVLSRTAVPQWPFSLEMFSRISGIVRVAQQ